LGGADEVYGYPFFTQTLDKIQAVPVNPMTSRLVEIMRYKGDFHCLTGRTSHFFLENGVVIRKDVSIESL
jgi:hypothetical protein